MQFIPIPNQITNTNVNPILTLALIGLVSLQTSYLPLLTFINEKGYVCLCLTVCLFVHKL